MGCRGRVPCVFPLISLSSPSVGHQQDRAAHRATAVGHRRHLGLAGDLARIAYGTSKAGAIAITRYVATQYGRQGIRCNAIAPGLIQSGQVQAQMAGLISNHVLTPRLGVPEDVAAVAAFLASDDAGFINGETIVCNGGSLAHQPHTHDLSLFLAAEAQVEAH